VQCVLAKTLESICCAVRHNVTLPRAVSTNDTLTTFYATTTDAARFTTPAVRSVGVVYYAVAAQRLLLAASYIFLVTFSVLYYVTDSFFPIVPLSISLNTVLSHNYRSTPVIKVIF